MDSSLFINTCYWFFVVLQCNLEMIFCLFDILIRYLLLSTNNKKMPYRNLDNGKNGLKRKITKFNNS